MDSTYCTQVEWIIAQLTTDGVSAYLLDQTPYLNGTYGKACCGHPSAAIDEAMAEGAIAFIKGKMGW